MTKNYKLVIDDEKGRLDLLKVIKKSLSNLINYATMPNKESQRAKAAYPPTKEGLPSRCKRRDCHGYIY